LYQVTNDTILPYLFVDFAGFGLPQGYCYMDYDQQRAVDVNTMAYLSNAYESNEYFYFKWGYKNRIRNNLWSKAKQKGIDFYWLYDDLDGLNQYISFSKWEDGKLLAMFNSVDIMTQDDIEKEKIYVKLVEKGWIPDENSNPIIALYEIDY